MTYQDFANKNVSEKIILAHVHSVKRAFLFTSDSGLYSKTMNYFVVGVNFNGVELISGTKAQVDSTHFHYEISTNKLYLNSYTDNDEIIVTFRHFFSNLPINLSWDLGDFSEEVEYLPRVSGYPSFKSTASNKKGISISGSGNLVFINNDDSLTELFDKHIFENKSVKIYSYNRELEPSQAKPLFFGNVTGKNYSLQNITLNLKDEIYTLSQPIPMETYGTLVTEQYEEKLKRIVFGKVDNMKVQSIDMVGEGYSLTGTITGYYGKEIVIGIGTKFKSELLVNDVIKFGEFEIVVDSVLSDTAIRVEQLDITFVNQIAIVKPAVSFYNKNRTFFVANHELKKPQCTITSIVSRNRINVDDVSEFGAGDYININGEYKTIRRISGNTLVLQTNTNLDHSIGETISKVEIFNVKYDGKLISNDDFTINNSSSGTTITLSERAELNSTSPNALKQYIKYYYSSNKLWLNRPTSCTITCVGQTKTGDTPISYSLYGKYFTLKDKDDNVLGFWFKDLLPEGISAVTKPSAIASLQETFAIELEPRVYSVSEIVKIVGDNIALNTDEWRYSTNINPGGEAYCILHSKEVMQISTGSVGTSGFTYTHVVGEASTSKIILSDIIKPRDFVKDSAAGDDEYIEVVEVGQTYIVLANRHNWPSSVGTLTYKNVNYISDDSIITVDCYGKSGITSPVDAVEYLVQTCGLSYDTTSFNNAKDKVRTELSLTLPLDVDGNAAPILKDIILLLNNTCNGILYLNDDLKLGYDLFDSEISNLKTIKDYDVISWNYSDDNFDSCLTTIGRYRHQDYDSESKGSVFKQTEFTNDITQKYVGISNSNYLDIYLYNENDVDTVNERYAFLNGLSSKVIKIKGILGLSELKVGMKVYVDLKRHKGIGMVQSLVNNGSTVDLEIVDFGNLIDYCSRVQENTASEYSSATTEERIFGSYITDNNGIIGTDEDTYGTNLIS